ncbi:protoporphyrinogen oxidase [Metallumcola ferriviriculae]|uniref:Coproporphyrinogen III oxidase n=1 Tax=Metallumcola ferriviriculae TaxID=3039180 RepID=A0AAU0UPE0_9FIRM|nr:protoporphyrinogen oxidase [Desulfitibacteraceae bacterium MK1]
MKKVTVIGGGISGLAAAYTLEQKGRDNYSVTLVEAGSELGGKMQSVTVDGFTVEGGPDCFLAQKPAVDRLSREIGADGDIIGTSEENKGTFILSGSKLHVLPEGLMLMVPTKIIPFALSPLISWPGKIRMGMDMFLPRRKGNGDESLGSFVTRRLGREALDKIAEPLIGGIHAGDPENMSLKASFPRFLEMERKHRSLIKAMLASKRQAPPQKDKKATYFMSFKHGMGELPQAVAEKLENVDIKLNTKVKDLQYDGKFTVTTSKGEQWQTDAVVLAVPAYAGADIIEGLEPQLAQTLRGINFVNSATVSLAFRKKDLGRTLPGFGFVIPSGEKRDIMAVTYSSQKFKHRSPDEDHLLVRCFVGGPKNQELVLLNDSEMLAKVQAELKSILEITAEPVMTKIFRWNQGMPQYSMGHLERVASIEQRLSKFPGLTIAGNSYRGIGVPDCIESGIRAAKNVMGEKEEH